MKCPEWTFRIAGCMSTIVHLSKFVYIETSTFLKQSLSNLVIATKLCLLYTLLALIFQQSYQQLQETSAKTNIWRVIVLDFTKYCQTLLCSHSIGILQQSPFTLSWYSYPKWKFLLGFIAPTNTTSCLLLLKWLYSGEQYKPILTLV